MDSRDLELSRPCPIDLDSLGVDRRQKRVFCSHCSAHVTDISKMSEVEAEAYVAANRGSGVCISYLRDEEGNVRFADSRDVGGAMSGPEERASIPRPVPSLVPLERLRHPAVRRAAAVAALALAACTPHGDHDDPYVESIDDVVMERTDREIPLAEEPSELPPVVEALPEIVEVPEEPCEPEVPVKTTKKKKPVRGRLKRRTPVKVDPDWDRVDGGI